MEFPQLILDDIETGKVYLSKLISDGLVDKKNGCVDCGCSDTTSCLKSILFSLDYKVSVNTYDATAESLYLQMMDIIGGIVPINITSTVFWGTWTGTTITEAQIVAANPLIIAKNADYEIPFGSGLIRKYFFAELIDEPVKVEYVDTVYGTEGNIGSPSDLFDAGIIVGNYRAYLNRYPTILLNPYLIKSST